MTGPRHRADTRAPAPAACFNLVTGVMGLVIATLIAHSALADEDIIRSHGYSYFGELSYPPDYKHLNYVNPEAPRGGEISIAVSGTFDSMNPYSRKGRASALSSSMYESLLGEILAGSGALPADVSGEYYGLLAHSIEYPERKDWVIFRMRPEARFSDGTPVTAHDVYFSHKLLLEQGLQSYAEAVKVRVPDAEVIDDHTIKFYFADGFSRRSLIETVGFTSVWSRKWYEETGAKLNESRFEVSPGSGPYVVDEVVPNRRVAFRRNPDYWGWHLPINQGRHNFDRIRLEYFADATAAFEAFKAGETTYRTESDPKKWATAYDFPALRRGQVVREELRDGNPPTMGGIVFNLGKEVLKDVRVRKAIALGFNFEWTNQSLYNGLYAQQKSFSDGTPLEAKGVPTAEEIAFLKSLGDVVPPELLTAPAIVPHSSAPDRLLPRKNRREAERLLDEAGWRVNEGRRENADGKPLRVTFLFNATADPTSKSIVVSFMANLRVMGIDARLDVVDDSQYTVRERDRDYDLILDRYPSLTGTGAGLIQRFGSADAAYSLFNPAGLASPLVDAVIEKSLYTTSQAEEDLAVRVLDRVLRHEFFLIPTGYVPDHLVAYWDMYDHPEVQPPYALGTLDFWWYNSEKAKALIASDESS
ncbi:extracellular solute-binding protein [Roseovarius sp. CAU 1744]|uniref:extracellular solute-binding protein n=1 Tax=Roseovarius sp. CAU 1744 TaxID=3140368 RepID=UPI00325C0516